jgi:hypothetical protein
MPDDLHEDSAQFRRFAKDCIRIAEQMQSVDDKAAMLVMAQVWIRLANQQNVLRFPTRVG